MPGAGYGPISGLKLPHQRISNTFPLPHPTVAFWPSLDIPAATSLVEPSDFAPPTPNFSGSLHLPPALGLPMICGVFPGPLRVPFQRPLISNFGFHSHCGQRPSPHLGLRIQHVHRPLIISLQALQESKRPKQNSSPSPWKPAPQPVSLTTVGSNTIPPKLSSKIPETILATPFLTLLTSHRPPSPVNPSFCSPCLFSSPAAFAPIWTP